MAVKKRKNKRPKKVRRGRGQSPAVVAAAFCMLIVVGYLGLRPNPVQSKQVVSEVKVTAEDDRVMLPTPVHGIAKGESLESAEFAMVSWPQSQLKGKFVQNIARYKNALAISTIPPNLPIPVEALSFGQNDMNAVAEGIPQGMRAITVKVSEEAAVEGWARSGSRVDVLVIRPGSQKGSGLETKVVAENVIILSAGRSVKPLSTYDSKAPKAPNTITLLVSQEDALKVKTAAAIGKLTFSLRGAGDREQTYARAMHSNQLFGGKPATTKPKRKRYKGLAKGPDGKVYVLDDEADWIRKVKLKNKEVDSNDKIN